MTRPRLAVCRWVLVRCTGNGSPDIPLGDQFRTRQDALDCARAERAAGPGAFALWLDNGRGGCVHGSWERVELTAP